MAFSKHGHISSILEANSKRPIREKNIRNRSYVEEIESGDFFPFLAKIFHNTQFSYLYFETSNNKRYCLHSIPNVSNEINFYKESIW